MVNSEHSRLDQVFSALADPTRRAMIAQLDRNPSLTVSELARPFDMTLPAVMKHLAVLTDAGLVNRVKTGRVVTCTLTPGRMEEAVDWLNRYQKYWSEGLDRLAAFVEAQGDADPPA